MDTLNFLNGFKPDKSFLKDLLKDNVLNVVFVKKDGSERAMECTLKADLLPETESTDSTRVDNPEIIRVYDLEKSGWRSFRLDSVLTFTIRS